MGGASFLADTGGHFARGRRIGVGEGGQSECGHQRVGIQGKLAQVAGNGNAIRNHISVSICLQIIRGGANRQVERAAAEMEHDALVQRVGPYGGGSCADGQREHVVDITADQQRKCVRDPFRFVRIAQGEQHRE